MRITEFILKEKVFYLSSQVAQAANALSNTISQNQAGCDGFLKETILLGADMQENETKQHK